MPRSSFVLVLLLFMSVLLFGAAGFGYSVPTLSDTVDPSISLLSPSPGETWYVGQTKSVAWLAADTNLSEYGIYIYYSLDGGATFIPLSEALANTGTYPFLIPEAESDNARVQVMAIDNFGNASLAANPLSFSYAPPLQVQHVVVSAIGNETTINWQAVTQNLLNEPVTPDGYLLFQSDQPFLNPGPYTLLANTNETTYTYQHDPQESRKFFYVVAYKGSMDRLGMRLPRARDAEQPSPGKQEIENLIRHLGTGSGK